jgi:hypothetical protein
MCGVEVVVAFVNQKDMPRENSKDPSLFLYLLPPEKNFLEFRSVATRN